MVVAKISINIAMEEEKVEMMMKIMVMMIMKMMTVLNHKLISHPPLLLLHLPLHLDCLQ